MQLNSLATFLCSLLLLTGNGLLAQRTNVDFNKVVLPAESRARNFEDYLVQLAWMNSPNKNILNTEVKIAQKDYFIEKQDWHKQINATFNMNEISLSKAIYGDRLDIPVFYPIYNFTAAVDLGVFTQRKRRMEKAKLQEVIAVEEINVEKLKLRREVLERYQEHRLAKQLLIARQGQERDANDTYTYFKRQFEAGKGDFEDFSRAKESYYMARESRLIASSDVKKTTILVEELIGVPLEMARKYGPKEEELEN